MNRITLLTDKSNIERKEFDDRREIRKKNKESIIKNDKSIDGLTAKELKLKREKEEKELEKRRKEREKEKKLREEEVKRKRQEEKKMIKKKRKEMKKKLKSQESEKKHKKIKKDDILIESLDDDSDESKNISFEELTINDKENEENVITIDESSLINGDVSVEIVTPLEYNEENNDEIEIVEDELIQNDAVQENINNDVNSVFDNNILVHALEALTINRARGPTRNHKPTKKVLINRLEQKELESSKKRESFEKYLDVSSNSNDNIVENPEEEPKETIVSSQSKPKFSQIPKGFDPQTILELKNSSLFKKNNM